jgi:UDP-N-acetylglucosamine--N-acetylmuramyl-(pentapeptide) pyrophosphoryl-undecaprenol N-acetylglucosamine transferase
MGAEKGLEARIVPDLGMDCILLPVQGLRRRAFWANLAVLADLVRSLGVAVEAFARVRPGVVVVTGGFAGAPAGIAAGVMGVPLALQEQNVNPGVTTRLLSLWATQVHLAFPEAIRRLPRKSRVRVSGNPIRPPVQVKPGEARSAFGLDPRGRVLLVTGGSQGAAAINEAVLEMVRALASGALRLPPDLQLLWITGPGHLAGVTRELKAIGNPRWVQLRGFTPEMPLAMRAATVAVSRAGAMTTSELLAHGTPAVLVPLPGSVGDHQALNARSLRDAGAAVYLPQGEVDGGSLWAAVEGLLEDEERRTAIASAALERACPEATRKIAEALAALLPRCGEVES